MKCPLGADYQWVAKGTTNKRWRECFEEECAWWDQVYGRCTVLALSQIFTAMGHVLGRIHDQMPKDFTPRG